MLKAILVAGFATIGLVQLIIANFLHRRMRGLVARGRRAPARTIGSTTSMTTSVKWARYDLLEFTADDGQVHKVSSRLGVPWSTTRGREITVLYDPADPRHAVIERWSDMWLAPLILRLTGAGILLAGAVLLILDALGIIESNLD